MPQITFALLLFVTLQRAAELIWSRANVNRLLAKGGHEVGAGHFPAMVLLHAAWLGGLWLLAWSGPIEPSMVLAYLFLQIGRGWILIALGRRWTARIIVVPGEQLIRSGPYRFLRHPNYVLVCAEIAVLPLCFGLHAYAIVFSLLNALVLAWRVSVENRALAEWSGRQSGKAPAAQ